MTPAQIEANLAAMSGWPGDLARQTRAHIQQEWPELTEFYKWNCLMWHKDGVLTVGVVPLKQALKLCFFQLPTTNSKLVEQRWSQTVASQNTVYTSREEFDINEVRLALRASKTK